jgi:hypothetical protein
MNPQGVLTIEEKADLVGNDLIAAAEAQASNLYYNNEPYLSPYIPSKKLLEIMDEHEIVAALNYLKSSYCVSYETRTRNIGVGSDAYAVTLKLDSLRATIKQHETERLLASTPLQHMSDIPPQGISFDKVRSVLTVNGTEILLGRTEGSKSLQYWVVFCTYPKPNKAIEELKILEKYDKENGDMARKRAVRDAVIALNKKIHEKIKLAKDPFIYSSGKVTYVEQDTNPYQFVSVKV